MSKVICDYSDIVAIADAVRSKGGITDQMTLGGIVTNINTLGSGTDVRDISGTFNLTLVEEDCEPMVNLYHITFDDLIQLKDVINLTLYFEYTSNSASYDNKIYKYLFSRMKTSESLLNLDKSTDASYIDGKFIIYEDDNMMQFLGVANEIVSGEYTIKYTLRNLTYEAISK